MIEQSSAAGFPRHRQVLPAAGHARRAVVVLAALTAAACARSPAPEAGPPPVAVAAAIERPIVEWDEFSGRIEAIESVEIRPRVPGYLQSVHFEEGREVRKGDLLFVIDPRPYEATLARAEAELARARAAARLAAQDAARAGRLVEARAISREEFDQRSTQLEESTAAVAAAEAAVRAARLDVHYTRITAPIAGRVGRAEVTVGNLVSAGPSGSTRLTTLVSIDPVHVHFEGDEQVYLKYTAMALRGERPSSRDAANPVRVGLANETGYPHAGRMDFVDNRVDPTTGTIRARAVLDNPQRLFTPGLYARVQLLGSGQRTAVLVDDRAIGTDQDKRYVMVVDGDNKVSYRAVRLGRLVDGLRVVEQGLKVGETIVVNGVQRVRPGTVVTPERVAMDGRVQAGETDGAPRLARR